MCVKNNQTYVITSMELLDNLALSYISTFCVNLSLFVLNWLCSVLYFKCSKNFEDFFIITFIFVLRTIKVCYYICGIIRYPRNLFKSFKTLKIVFFIYPRALFSPIVIDHPP